MRDHFHTFVVTWPPEPSQRQRNGPPAQTSKHGRVMSTEDDKKPVARAPVPPPGQRLDFDAWCRRLTAELRRYLPDVKASTNGRDRVTWRFGGQEVTCTNDRGCYRIQLDPRFGGLQDGERHDGHTATAFAKTMAGHFEPRFSVADR